MSNARHAFLQPLPRVEMKKINLFLMITQLHQTAISKEKALPGRNILKFRLYRS